MELEEREKIQRPGRTGILPGEGERVQAEVY